MIEIVRDWLAGNDTTVASDNITLSGDNTHSGTNTFSGTNTHSGTNTFSGAVDFTGVQTTATRFVDDRFNPYNRVYARSSFANRLYTKAVISDWSVFKSVASANLDWVVSGSATAYGGTAGTSGAAVLSGSNSSAYCFIKPSTGSPFNRIKWYTNKSPEFDFVIKTGTLTDANIAVGLFSATYPRGNAIGAASSGSNRIEVYIDQNGTSRAGTGSGGSWRVGVAGSGASSPAVATGTNANSSTVYHVRISVDSSRIVRVYINDMTTAVYTSTLALTTGKALIPMVVLQSEGAKRNMQIAHIVGSQNFS